jgi:hypothetical protein
MKYFCTTKCFYRGQLWQAGKAYEMNDCDSIHFKPIGKEPSKPPVKPPIALSKIGKWNGKETNPVKMSNKVLRDYLLVEFGYEADTKMLRPLLIRKAMEFRNKRRE